MLAALRLLAVPESVIPAAATDAAVVPREVTDARLVVHQLLMADHRVGDRPQAWIEEELRILEAVEQVKAWLDFQGLAALRRLRQAMGELVRDRDAEIWLATGHGMTDTARVSKPRRRRGLAGDRTLTAHLLQSRRPQSRTTSAGS